MENYNLLSGVEQMEKKRGGGRLQEIVTKRHEIQATAKESLRYQEKSKFRTKMFSFKERKELQVM